MSVSMSDAKIKELFKQAFLELLEERREELYDLFAEVMEDLALANAIQEGAATESVSREAIFEVLEGAG